MESRLLHDQATEGDYGRIEVLKRIAHTQAHYVRIILYVTRFAFTSVDDIDTEDITASMQFHI